MRNKLSLHAAAAAAIAALMTLSAPAFADRDQVRNGKSWSIQLQGDARKLKQRDTDVAVVDPDEVRNPNGIKTKKSGGKRAVLAYISVGESEDYRKDVKHARNKSWTTNNSTGWKGNKTVKYWDPEWQRIVKKRVRAAIDAGYDGVYLDRIDAYEQVKAPKGSRAEMVKFVKEIAAEARSRKKNAAVAVQNAEELLTDGSYVDAIDAVGKEDLYHGVKHDGRRNAKDGVKWSKNLLNKAKAKGKGVYVVEYVGGGTAKKVKDEARRDGFVASTGERSLKAATE